jgi:CspA family cold shock protein
MIMGAVKFHNGMTGCGFIGPTDDSKDVFVHATATQGIDMPGLGKGQKASFAEDPRSGKIVVNTIQTA